MRGGVAHRKHDIIRGPPLLGETDCILRVGIGRQNGAEGFPYRNCVTPLKFLFPRVMRLLRVSTCLPRRRSLQITTRPPEETVPSEETNLGV